MGAESTAGGGDSRFAWRHMFVGREPDMAYLQERWDDARKGRPQVVVLLGESGLGKTRLVQEFYRWLSAAADPGGYWPDAFTDENVSLDVNPRFPADHRPTASIPWLWWGLRWTNPEGRNRVGEVALRDFRHVLLAHTEPIVARRRLKQVAGTVSLTAANLVGNLIPFANLIFVAKDLHSLAGNIREGADLLRRGPSSAFDAEQKQLVELDRLARDYFRTILDPKNKHAETVPIILLLDDAQWADATTLRFVEQVTSDAVSYGWPLLVLVTHWEKEWHERLQQFPRPTGQPERLTDLFLAAQNAGPSWNLRIIQPLRDLSAIVHSALPGLLPEQRQLLVNRAGGNPYLLEEILRFLLHMPNYFIKNRCDQALQPRAVQKISEQEFSLHALVQVRFNDLQENVRRVLGWSSVQGVRFLTAITQAAARKIAPEVADEDVRDCLHQAENPHCLVQPADDAGRFNRIEFRQAVFYEVARRSLDFNEAEQAAVQEAAKETLIHWLTTDAIDQLPAEECRDALEMARVALRPASGDDDNCWRAWGQAMVRLKELLASDYLFDQAGAVAREIIDARPLGWPCALLPPLLQVGLLIEFLPFMERDLYPEYRRLVLESLCRQHVESGGDLFPSGSFESVTLHELAEEFSDDRPEEALLIWRSFIKGTEATIQNAGDSKERLCNLSAYFLQVGDIERAAGRHIEAIDAFLRSLEAADRILDKFGETVDNLRGVAAVELRLVKMDELIGDIDDACNHSIRASMMVLIIIDRGWGTPDDEQALAWIDENLRRLIG